MRKLITSYGRYDVVEETLADAKRTKVYSVIFPSEDGAVVILACPDNHAAQQVANMLQTRVIDVSLRDKEGSLS